MPDLPIIYRTSGPQGPGIDRRLTKYEVDANMWALAQAIVELQDNRPAAAEIASITVNGRFMTITLTDARVFGPFPLPIVEHRFRSALTPLTLYDPLDWFTVAGVGVYSVIYPYTSGAEFDETVLVDGLPALKKLFGPDAGAVANVIVHDIEFIFQGRLSTITDPLNYLALRSILVPATDVHAAYIAEPPATAAQVLPVMHDATVIGHVIFAIGSNTGLVTINADEPIDIGGRLAIGPPADTDGVAAAMTIALAAQRVL